MIVREIISAICFILGVFVFVSGVIGVYKFKYVLNKMHCAALGDTLGLLFICIGAAVYYGFSFATLKVLIIVILFWFASPISSHLIAMLETNSNPKAKGKEYEEIDMTGKENR